MLQLVYTSAPRLLEAGKTGFGTVARSRELPASLVAYLERLSSFDRSAGVSEYQFYSEYRMGGTRYRIFSRVADCGVDYTRRTNHIAHHLVTAEGDEEETRMAASTPAGVLQALAGAFLRTWTGNPTWLQPQELPAVLPLHGNGSWQQACGQPAYARWLANLPKSGCYLTTAKTYSAAQWAELLHEGFLTCPDHGWGVAFTTAKVSTLRSSDFLICCVDAAQTQAGVTLPGHTMALEIKPGMQAPPAPVAAPAAHPTAVASAPNPAPFVPRPAAPAAPMGAAPLPPQPGAPTALPTGWNDGVQPSAPIPPQQPAEPAAERRPANMGMYVLGGCVVLSAAILYVGLSPKEEPQQPPAVQPQPAGQTTPAVANDAAAEAAAAKADAAKAAAEAAKAAEEAAAAEAAKAAKAAKDAKEAAEAAKAAEEAAAAEAAAKAAVEAAKAAKDAKDAAEAAAKDAAEAAKAAKDAKDAAEAAAKDAAEAAKAAKAAAEAAAKAAAEAAMAAEEAAAEAAAKAAAEAAKAAEEAAAKDAAEAAAGLNSPNSRQILNPNSHPSPDGSNTAPADGPKVGDFFEMGCSVAIAVKEEEHFKLKLSCNVTRQQLIQSFKLGENTIIHLKNNNNDDELADESKTISREEPYDYADDADCNNKKREIAEKETKINEWETSRKTCIKEIHVEYKIDKKEITKEWVQKKINEEQKNSSTSSQKNKGKKTEKDKGESKRMKMLQNWQKCDSEIPKLKAGRDKLANELPEKKITFENKKKKELQKQAKLVFTIVSNSDGVCEISNKWKGLPEKKK